MKLTKEDLKNQFEASVGVCAELNEGAYLTFLEDLVLSYQNEELNAIAANRAIDDLAENECNCGCNG